MLIVIIANAEIKLMQLFSQKSFNELATKHAGDRRNVTEGFRCYDYIFNVQMRWKINCKINFRSRVGKFARYYTFIPCFE